MSGPGGPRKRTRIHLRTFENENESIEPRGRAESACDNAKKRRREAHDLVVNPNKIGLVIGALLGGWHVLWSFLVAIGWAQPFIDFIFWAHMIRSIYVIKGFDPVAAVTLIVITSVTGYIAGYAGAIIWNRVHRQP